MSMANNRERLLKLVRANESAVEDDFSLVPKRFPSEKKKKNTKQQISAN